MKHPIDFRALVMAHNGHPVTTSLKVAEAFNKHHKNVLATIRKLDCSPDFAGLNFELCFQNNDLQNSKPQPYYTMTKDGFVFLVMGFTGKEAAVFKEGYIGAFNWMQDIIMQQGMTLSKRHNLLSLRFDHEKSGASAAGRALREWRDAGANLVAEMLKIEEQMQPMLGFKEFEASSSGNKKERPDCSNNQGVESVTHQAIEE